MHMGTEQYKLTDKTAVVTGSSSGIGKAIAKKFAGAGANVVVCAPEDEQDNMDDVVASINQADHQGQAVSTPCDVTDRSTVEALAETTVKEFGEIDVLVNNAGGGFPSPFRNLNMESWDNIVDLNLGGTFNCSHILGEQMIDSGGGNIINIASMAGINGLPNMSPYAAAKAAIINFTRTLSFELATFDIRVNAIAPGLVVTERVRGDREKTDIPAPEELERGDVARRAGLPEEIADMAQVLASPAASYVTGHAMQVSGVPRLERHLDVDYYDVGETVWISE
jgi:NAD(P)-dependent dehydrogenase (short-subunit alcohol dehydrogenase family)